MSIGWPDLPGALLLLTAGLLIVTALVGFGVWDARRRRSPSVVVEVAGAIARLWVGVAAVGLCFAAWRWFAGADVWIEDVPLVADIPGLACGGIEPSTSSATPTLVCGSVQSADLTIAGLGAGMRILFAASEILALLVVAVAGVVLAIACAQALKGVPFSRVVSRWLFIGAVVVLIAGLGSELSGSVGRTILSNELLPDGGANVISTGVYRVTLSFWPVCAAFALAALGAVFRHGERLERETAGLV